jgi:tRNA(Ile)-lysidine synthase
MKLVDLKPGKYVVAVSGGVDSIVLLDLLSNLPALELIVAHFNHGTRSDAPADEELVTSAAAKLGLAYEVGYGRLGARASEEKARNARYKFLMQVKDKYGAVGIIMAHHQDDLIETALINILRGSGRRGLTAILENPDVIRPLMNVTKKEVLDYAHERKLKWREDNTNRQIKYLRNYIRRYITPKLTDKQRAELLGNIQKVAKNNQTHNDLIAIISQSVEKNNQIDRQSFINLPLEVENELIMEWLRRRNVKDIDRKMVERLTVAVKAAGAKSRHPVKKNLELVVEANSAYFTNTV